MMKIRRKRQESDSGHFVKSLYARAMIQTSQEEFKLALKKKLTQEQAILFKNK